MNFEWHPSKAESNLEKHGVSFDEAKTFFNDPLQIHFRDDLHSIGEQRYLCLGISDRGRVLTLVYTEEKHETIRVISAREATSREQKRYETQSDITCRR